MHYIVTEIQTLANGQVASANFAFDTESAALAKYYTLLAGAAVSNLPCHAVTMYTSEGFHLHKECFKHT